ATATELELCTTVARALFNRGVRLGKLGRIDEAIASFNDVVGRFETANELTLRELVASALVQKGITLSKAKRFDEAIAAWDETVRRFGTAAEPSLRKPVEEAQLLNFYANKFVKRRKRNKLKPAQEIVLYNILIRGWDTAAKLVPSELIAHAL